MEKSIFCIQPLEIPVIVRVSWAWTPLCSTRLHWCNFSPRSGWIRGCWGILSWNKVVRERKIKLEWRFIEKTRRELMDFTGSLIRKGFIRRSRNIGRVHLFLKAHRLVPVAKSGKYLFQSNKTFDCKRIMFNSGAQNKEVYIFSLQISATLSS